MDKKDGKLCMCINYHALNKITIKNNYPLPRINNLFDRLNGASYFRCINLKLRYYEIHVQDADVEKMAMRTKYGFYEFLVMSFGLCNALSTFTTLMNLIFHEKLNEFIIIYMDDILVYSKSMEKHVSHLEFVLQKLRKIKLYVNQAKNKFVSLEMDILGHVLSQEGVKPSPRKLNQLKNGKVLFQQKGLGRS
jgi:hypothetical protein